MKNDTAPRLMAKKSKAQFLIRRNDTGLYYDPVYAADKEWPVWSPWGQLFSKKDAEQRVSQTDDPKSVLEIIEYLQEEVEQEDESGTSLETTSSTDGASVLSSDGCEDSADRDKRLDSGGA